MPIDDQIRDETIQYNVNKEAAKISALSTGKTNKYKYQISKYTYSPLGKAFQKKNKEQGEKQGKTTEEHGEQLVESNALIKKCDTGKESTPFLK